MQRRTLKMQDARVREQGGKRYLEGYFAVFNLEYKVCDSWSETIAPGAFAEFLATGADVKVLWNHNHDIVLGSTAALTAVLREDSLGLWGSVEINEKDQDAVNAHARVERGDVDGCSFGFDIAAWEETWDGDQYRTKILKVDPLYEVSPCTFPAYSDTSIHARAKEDLEKARERYIEAEQTKRENWRQEMRRRLKGED